MDRILASIGKRWFFFVEQDENGSAKFYTIDTMSATYRKTGGDTLFNNQQDWNGMVLGYLHDKLETRQHEKVILYRYRVPSHATNATTTLVPRTGTASYKPSGVDYDDEDEDEDENGGVTYRVG